MSFLKTRINKIVQTISTQRCVSLSRTFSTTRFSLNESTPSQPESQKPVPSLNTTLLEKLSSLSQQASQPVPVMKPTLEPQSSFPYVSILAGRHNTRALFSSADGKIISHVTGGLLGLRKTNRGTQDAGYQVAVRMSELAVKKGFNLSKVNAVLKLKGFGPGRGQAVRGLQSAGWSFVSVVDVTPVKWGGARPPKRRRI